MDNKDLKDFAAMAVMCHGTGPVVYVGSAVNEEIAPDDSRLVVMVNERGDRIATKPPGGDWKIEAVKVSAQFPNLPKSKVAIKIDIRPLENK